MAGEGEAVGAGVGAGVGATASASKAPISQTALPSPFPSVGRGKRRWSLTWQALLSPASIAGLPLSRACARVVRKCEAL
jgi:hypothetical protein